MDEITYMSVIGKEIRFYDHIILYFFMNHQK